MQLSELTKPMMDFNKAMFESAWNGITLMNDRVEQITTRMLGQISSVSDENKKMISDWTKLYKKICDDCKISVDSGFKSANEILTAGSKKA